ncbi:MAG: hypothetical protein JW749_07525 [Sedimentisphaerales bacterium]|nr:hypothetical protein [Sedimentisphaerales bacterium]
MIYVNDSNRVWHVAKSGNDGNSGHAGQYPVNLTSDAKLTISAAVSAAADGDTIIIWPGDYAEAVNASSKALRMIGMHRGQTRIVPSSGTPLQIGNDSYVANLSAVASSGTIGINIPNKTNITIENCYGYGPTDGLYISASTLNNYNIRLINCTFESPWDGANMNGATGVFLERCMFKCTGGSQVSHALQLPGSGVYHNCIFWTKSSTASSNPLGGIELGSAAEIRAIFESCYIYAEANASRTGDVFGVKVNHSASAATLNNCNILTIGPGASGGPKDLYQTNGQIIVNGSRFLTQSGTIIQDGCGWANAVRQEAAAVIDMDEALQKAIKMLVNKAVQDKLTGAIQYYDDDGQTVLLTHTPSENESSLTRAVS